MSEVTREQAAKLARWYRGIAADYRAAADRCLASHLTPAQLDELLDAADAAELLAFNYAQTAED